MSCIGKCWKQLCLTDAVFDRSLQINILVSYCLATHNLYWHAHFWLIKNCKQHISCILKFLHLEVEYEIHCLIVAWFHTIFQRPFVGRHEDSIPIHLLWKWICYWKDKLFAVAFSRRTATISCKNFISK